MFFIFVVDMTDAICSCISLT